MMNHKRLRRHKGHQEGKTDFCFNFVNFVAAQGAARGEKDLRFK
jgi:hypothetical protein